MTRYLVTLGLLWLAGAGMRLTILAVPPVLLSGHHKDIARWRRELECA